MRKFFVCLQMKFLRKKCQATQICICYLSAYWVKMDSVCQNVMFNENFVQNKRNKKEKSLESNIKISYTA